MTKKPARGQHATIQKATCIQVAGSFDRFDADGRAVVRLEGGDEHRGTLITAAAPAAAR